MIEKILDRGALISDWASIRSFTIFRKLVREFSAQQCLTPGGYLG